MSNEEIKDAVLKLVEAKNAQEVSKLLNEDKFLSQAKWQYYGRSESNFSIISAQARDSVNALVEKLINSVDAILMAECLKAGIDPKSKSAPSTMKKAVEKFFKVNDGDISKLPLKERRSLAGRINLIADGDKERPNITIVDSGEGQNPSKFWDTFLKLPIGSSNKADIKFVQGKYNMGSTGALMFAGDPELHYQLLISRRHPEIKDSDQSWGFTIVRQSIKEGTKTPTFECLVDENSNFYSFQAEDLPLLPNNNPFKYGTYIKLYSYFLRNASNINLDLWRPLNRRLFTSTLPITLYESRFSAERIHGASRIMEGNHFRINGEENKWVEKQFEVQSDLGKLGNRTIRITVFKDQIKESGKDKDPKIKLFPQGEFTTPTEAVFFTVNGQTHHTLGRSTLETQANLRNLAKYLMVHVDASDSGPIINEIFHGAREIARENSIYREIEDRLISDLRDNPVLRVLDEEYKRREISRIQPDDGFIKNTAARILRENPEWARQLFSGIDVPITIKNGSKPVKFTPSYIPTFLKLRGEEIKPVPRNRKYTNIYFETDASDDYLTREENRGYLTIVSPNRQIDKSYWLNGGLLSLKFITPENIEAGTSIDVKVALTRPGTTDLTAKLVLTIEKEKELNPNRPNKKDKNTGESFNLPAVDSVNKERWEEFGWDGKDVALFSGSVIHINKDSNDLQSFLTRYETHYSRDSIVKAYETAIYLYTFILDNELSSEENKELVLEGGRDKFVSRMMRGISKVVLPINFKGFLQEI